MSHLQTLTSLNDREHILISLEPRYAEGILDRTKLVEFRRRTMNVKADTTVWLYAKLPVGSIVGRATVRANHNLTPSTLWRRFGSVSGLSRAEFANYFDGVSLGTVLELSHSHRLSSSFSLEALRSFQHKFQPPQFFSRLSVGSPVLAAVLGLECGGQTSLYSISTTAPLNEADAPNEMALNLIADTG